MYLCLTKKIFFYHLAATDAATQKRKKNHGWRITASIISNEEMEGIVKLVKPLEEWRLLIKGYNETIKNEGKE